jgi:hypothetical protein
LAHISRLSRADLSTLQEPQPETVGWRACAEPHTPVPQERVEHLIVLKQDVDQVQLAAGDFLETPAFDSSGPMCGADDTIARPERMCFLAALIIAGVIGVALTQFTPSDGLMDSPLGCA